MIPDKHQPDTTQTSQNNSEPINNQNTSQEYKPDWIIPDNGTSSRGNEKQNKDQDDKKEREGNAVIPMDNDDILGIP